MVADIIRGGPRVLARREQVRVVSLVKRWTWSILGFGKNGSRSRDTKLNCTYSNTSRAAALL
jgi:hypothetical protein